MLSRDLLCPSFDKDFTELGASFGFTVAAAWTSSSP